ncbi:hypothetical protein IMSHALPRED_004591 [Imshaugia aleurites]|uniref:USP domain-containing protein n=1 Tax=Imshaugia aleurites TaxID=172621 RepID=A0A8H3F953_9LECA|nr:hypothetical protein IMSHALPRED_004591 [Imshaugia aleurites]
MRGDQSLLYDCRAVIYHRGDDLRAGRYVAYVRESLRDEESQQWILYDDEVMSIAQQQDVMVGSLNPGHSWDKACANHKEGIELVDPSPPDPDDESTLTTPPRSSPSTSQVAEIKQGAVDPEDQLNKARVALEQARANPKTSGAVLRTLQIDLRRKKKAYNVAN